MTLLTPWRTVLLNRVLRRLQKSPATTPWQHGPHRVWLSDDKRSETLEIVYTETMNGFYTPPLSLRTGDTVVDVGAHVGGFCIPLALAHPSVRVLALEPDRRNFANLLSNVKRAKAWNIQTLHAGVWSMDTMLKSHHHPENTGGSNSRPDNPGTPEAPGYTWEHLRETYRLHTIRLLKMDCEGAEYQCLRSDHDLLGVESMLAEIHGGSGTQAETAALIERINRMVPHNRLQVLPAKGKPYTTAAGRPWVAGNMDPRPNAN